MDEIKFASFNSLMAMGDQSKEQIQNYYSENNLMPSNEYLKRYLGITEDKPIQKIPELKQSSNTFDIGESLAKIRKYPVFEENTDDVPVTNRAKTAMNFFLNKGLSKEIAAGIVGNLQSESGLNPGIEGDKDLPTSSVGIAQWREKRLDNLKNFAKKSGKKYTDFNTQLEFLWSELQGSESKALSELLKTKDPVSAARIFAHKFERMKKYNKEREINASKFYRI